MKYIITSVLVLLIAFTSCAKGKNVGNEKQNNQSIENGNTGGFNNQTIKIDTVTIVDYNVEEKYYSTFDDEWNAKALQTLRKNEVPLEVILVENNYSELQDSMLVFTGKDFRYSFLIVTHMKKNILESFEENNLNTRVPMIKGIKERGQSLIEEMGIQWPDRHVLHRTTETNSSNIFLGIEQNEILSMQYFGWVD